MQERTRLFKGEEPPLVRTTKTIVQKRQAIPQVPVGNKTYIGITGNNIYV